MLIQPITLPFRTNGTEIRALKPNSRPQRSVLGGGFGVTADRHELHHAPCENCFSSKRSVIQWPGIALRHFLKTCLALNSDKLKDVIPNESDNGKTSVKQSEQITQDGVEHGTRVGRRTADGGEYFSGCGLPL